MYQETINSIPLSFNEPASKTKQKIQDMLRRTIDQHGVVVGKIFELDLLETYPFLFVYKQSKRRGGTLPIAYKSDPAIMQPQEDPDASAQQIFYRTLPISHVTSLDFSEPLEKAFSPRSLRSLNINNRPLKELLYLTLASTLPAATTASTPGAFQLNDRLQDMLPSIIHSSYRNRAVTRPQFVLASQPAYFRNLDEAVESLRSTWRITEIRFSPPLPQE